MANLTGVLEFLDNTGKTMVKRVPEDGECQINWGTSLIVRESQKAVFFRDGMSLDVYGPGRHTLQTQILPYLTKLVTSIAFGSQSPFKSEVYFLNMKLFHNMKWGTKEPVLFRDTELQMIRLRAYGTFSIQIKTPTVFLNKVVGTMGLYQDSDIEDYLRNMIVTRMTDSLGNHLKTIFDIPIVLNQLSEIVRSKLLLDFEGLGLSLHDFYINSVSVPPAVQILIDERSGMAAVGNLDKFMQYKAALSLEKAAENSGGTTAAGVGVGYGLGLGSMLPQMIQKSFQPDKGSTKAGVNSSSDKIKKEIVEFIIKSDEEYEDW